MNTTRRYFLFLAFALLLGSCKDTSQKAEPAWEQTPVSGVRMAFDRPKVGFFPLLSDKDCMFFRLHRSENHAVALYRIQGDSLLFLREILPKGDGPEDLYIPQIKLFRDTLYALGLFNGENKILKTAWPLSDDSLQAPLAWKSLHWNKYFDLKDGYPLNDSTLLVTGSQNDNQAMFFLFYPAQERLVPAGFDFPDDIPGNSLTKSIIYSGSIEKHPQFRALCHRFRLRKRTDRKSPDPLRRSAEIRTHRCAPEQLAGVRRFVVGRAESIGHAEVHLCHLQRLHHGANA